jgi:hypothetical protein
MSFPPQKAETKAPNDWYKDVLQSSLQGLFVSTSAKLSVQTDMLSSPTERHIQASGKASILFVGF